MMAALGPRSLALAFSEGFHQRAVVWKPVTIEQKPRTCVNGERQSKAVAPPRDGRKTCGLAWEKHAALKPFRIERATWKHTASVCGRCGRGRLSTAIVSHTLTLAMCQTVLGRMVVAPHTSYPNWSR